MGIALFGADKFIFPDKSGFTMCAKQTKGRHVQIGSLLEHRKVPDDSHSIASFTDDMFIRPATRTALLVADGKRFDVKFIRSDVQDLVNF
ncbi:hypothetical protein D3C81_1514770 [compost metagenome]